MGLFDALLGNASEVSEVDVNALEDTISAPLVDIFVNTEIDIDVLINKENVTRAYSLLRDLIVFTDKRLILIDKILIDKQGFSGKKQAMCSIPYGIGTTASVSFLNKTPGVLVEMQQVSCGYAAKVCRSSYRSTSLLT